MAMEAWLRVWVSSRSLEQRLPRAAPAELPLPWGWRGQGACALQSCSWLTRIFKAQ